MTQNCPVIPNECWILGEVKNVLPRELCVLVERSLDLPPSPNFAACYIGYHIGIICSDTPNLQIGDKIEAVVSFRGDEQLQCFVLKEYQAASNGGDYMLQENDLIELVSMRDELNPPPVGTRGTVQMIIESGPHKQIVVNWETGCTLMLVEGIDRYRLVSRP